MELQSILLTGASGFIGSRLAEVLQDRCGSSAKVILLTSRPRNGFTCVMHHGYTYKASDLLVDGVESIDAVVHLGGFVAKTYEERDDAAKQFSTLANTQYLLSHLPNVPKVIIYCSSTAVYADHRSGAYLETGRRIDESTPPEPADYYGLTKYASELLVGDWCRISGTVCQVLRLGPVFGPGDLRKKMMMMKMMTQASSGKSLSLWANPCMRRNYLFIDDCCKFISSSLRLDESVGPINICSINNPTVLEITQEVARLGGVGYEVVAGNETGQDIIIDATKRRRLLGEESVTFEEGMARTYRWVCEG